MPADLQTRFREGLDLFDQGRVDEAIRVLGECRRSDPGNPHIILNLGHAFGAAGKADRAVDCYRELLRVGDPEMAWAAAWSLADLKGYRFTPGETEWMEAQAAITAGRDKRFLLMFALGRAREQQCEHAAAFQAYREANGQVAGDRPFPAAAWRNLADSLRTIESVPRSGTATEGPVPVFIVGMPRSGSTLVEQILGAHSRVQATSELPFIENLARSLDRQGGFAQTLPRMNPGQCRQGAAVYMEQATPLLSGSPGFFTDKWPDNFWFVGLIRALFPAAPIINVFRDPLDNAMAVYKQYFSRGIEHSSRLDWTAGYWEIYLDVMTHWEGLLPGQVLHLPYAQLVTETEHTVRRLLTHCGLAYEEQVLRFHERDRAVMTPSGQQVRQPIHKGALGSAQPFRPYLGELLPRFDRIRERTRIMWERH